MIVFIKRNLFKIVSILGYEDFYNEYKQNKILKKLKSQDKEKSRYIPQIEVININANDICNSKCVMCNIWERKKDFEITPNQLGNILKDSLFKNVEHIGVTGGEPTLREDLPELYKEIIISLPNIKGLSIISNCIKEKDVIRQIEKVKSVCDSYDKNFSVMLSLDGYEETHDKIRGRKGNFESVLYVIDHLAIRNIPITTGSTISKDNVWEMDELLDFLRERNLYGRFRVAEFIKRLYNDDKVDIIRNFTDDESYNLILFFYKLIFTFETNPTFLRTYKSIINILSGGKRLIGCPYHNNGVVLDSRGELAYCAPKSKIIGSAIKKSALQLYNNNLQEKKRIIKEECKECIHDYHSPITYEETKRDFEERYWKNFIKIDSLISFSKQAKIKPTKKGEKQIFITGWYGTETVGDKAILGGIIQELYQQHNPNISIIVTSLYPIITKRTLRELNINAYVIDVYSKDFISYAKGADLIIMGGGPLMDLEELALPLISFKIGKLYNIKTKIYGCGLGPLYTERCKEAVKEIINLADEIELRDQASINLAKSWCNIPKDIKLSGDPAKKYLANYINIGSDLEQENVLTCYLREWTYEYGRDFSKENYELSKLEFEESIANFIKSKAIELNVDSIRLDHMHNFVIGNDDRDFSRYFIKKYFKNFDFCSISYNKKLSTVDSIVKSMKTSKYNITMRFHSVVFAHTLNTDFMAIDYTRGGKIANFLNDNKETQRLLSWDDIIYTYGKKRKY